MKTMIPWVLGLTVAISSVSVYAAESSQVVADHEAMAVSYEQKAAAEDALIAEHTAMKQDYKAKYFINEKVTPIDKIRKMENHCDAIIRDAQTLKSELLAFAKLHRMQAAEIKGQ